MNVLIAMLRPRAWRRCHRSAATAVPARRSVTNAWYRQSGSSWGPLAGLGGLGVDAADDQADGVVVAGERAGQAGLGDL